MPVICNLPTKIESGESNLSLSVGIATDLGYYSDFTHQNITTVTHAETTSYPLRMQQYVDMFEDYLTEFTLESDTGTGTSRVIIYSADGLGSKRLKLYHNSDGTVCFALALSDGTAIAYYNDTNDYSWSATSKIIKNGSTILIMFYASGSMSSCMLISKSGSLSVASAGYINFCGCSYLTDDASSTYGLHYATLYNKTSDNEIVLFPLFASTNSTSSTIAKEPIDNLYATYSVSNFHLYSINEHTYLALYLDSQNSIVLFKID